MQAKIAEYVNTIQRTEGGDAFQETEIGLFPRDWRVVTLGELCEVKGGKRLPKGHRFAEAPALYPYIRVVDFRNYSVKKDDLKFLTPQDYQLLKRYVISHEDVYISIAGTTGLVGVVPEDLDGAVLTENAAKLLIRNKRKVWKYFLMYFLASESGQVQIYQQTTKAVQPKLALGRIKQILIPLPPFLEQQKIAKALGAIQRAIQQQDKIMEATKNLKKSLMQKLFTEGLKAEEQRETEIGLIPKSWKVVRLEELFDIQQGKAMSPKARLGIYPHPFLRTVNVLWGRIDLSTLDYMDFSDEEITRLCLQPGDLLVCEGGETGRTAMWRGEVEVCGYQNHIHRLRKRRQDVQPEFYMYWMQAAFLIFGLYAGEAIRTTIPNLSGGRLKSFLLPKPPKPEQQEIAHFLNIVDRKIDAEERRKNGLKEFFKTMLHKLMTAEIRLEDIEV